MWAKLLRANAAYAIGSAANSAALFLLVPYLVNTLPVAEYGKWSILEIAILFMTMFILAGMDVGLMRYYWFLDSERDKKRLSGTILIAIIAWGSVLGMILYVVLSVLKGMPALSSVNDLIKPSILLFVLGIGLVESVFNYLLNFFRIREQAVLFASLSVGKMILFLTGAIIGVSMTGSVIGVLSGRLGASVIGIAGALFYSYRFIAFDFDIQYFKRVIAYGLPLLPANGAAYILIASDRYILNIFSTLEIVAIYSFAYKIATVLDVMITRPFATDWAARRFQIARGQDAPNKYADILIIYTFISSFAALALLFVAPVAYQMIAPDSYQDGLRVLPILLLAIIISGLSYPLNIGIVIKDKTQYAAGVGIFAALVCLGIEFILIPRYGMIGAAWATVISYTIWTGGIAYFSLQFYPVPYHIKSLVILCATIVLGYLGANLIFITSSNGNLPILNTFLSISWLTLVFGGAGLILRKSLQTQ